MGLFGKKKNNPFATDELQKTLHKNLDFTASEQYRLLRTNIQFTIPEDVACPIIGVTSSIRGEGKSTTAVNLSYVIAEKGRKVLLIDGDLRIPSIAKKLDLKSAPGLTDMLLGSALDIEGFRSELNPNLYIMQSGEIPPNPSELIGSRRMGRLLNRLKEVFDYIIIDLPPVNIVSDAMSISNHITGLVVVIREDYTSKKDLEQCMRQIKLSNVNVLGCVMNGSGGAAGRYKRYGKYGRYGRYGRRSKYYKYRTYEQEPSEGSDD